MTFAEDHVAQIRASICAMKETAQKKREKLFEESKQSVEIVRANLLKALAYLAENPYGTTTVSTNLVDEIVWRAIVNEFKEHAPEIYIRCEYTDGHIISLLMSWMSPHGSQIY